MRVPSYTISKLVIMHIKLTSILLSRQCSIMGLLFIHYIMKVGTVTILL